MSCMHNAHGVSCGSEPSPLPVGDSALEISSGVYSDLKRRNHDLPEMPEVD